MEFAEQEAVDKTLMVAQLWDMRELEVKVAADAGYPAWQAYWCWRREDAKADTVARKAAEAAARMEATN
jgi:hypothetical protein